MDKVLIEPDTVAWLKIDAYDLQNELLEEGPKDGLPVLIGHEKALLGKMAGDKISVTLDPEDAFGESEPDLIKAVPLNLLGDNVEEGMRLEGIPGDDSDHRIYTVIGSNDNFVYLDGNHPLAGWSLRFEIEVIKVEKASPEEIEQMESSDLMPDFLQVSDISRKDIQ